MMPLSIYIKMCVADIAPYGIFCQQDGDYNCDIPAQRSIQLNKRWKTGVNDGNSSYTATTPPRNGLCDTCNRNQEIKMQQLASFEPNVKENFDIEIEHFR